MSDAEPRRCRCGHKLTGDEHIPLCPRCRESYAHRLMRAGAVVGTIVVAAGGVAAGTASLLGKLTRRV